MAIKEELTGRLRYQKSRNYDGDFASVVMTLQQEWRLWPDFDESPDYCWEEWRDIREVWEE